MWIHWTSGWSDSMLLQLIALDPRDNLFVEKFLGIKPFVPVPAVPKPNQAVTGLSQGKLPQSLPTHLSQDHQHPLALPPKGFPKYVLLNDKGSEKEVTKEILTPSRNTPEDSWLIKELLFNPQAEEEAVKRWLEKELLPATPGLTVELHPEEELQMLSEVNSISSKVKTDSHTLWSSFVIS